MRVRLLVVAVRVLIVVAVGVLVVVTVGVVVVVAASGMGVSYLGSAGVRTHQNQGGGLPHL